MEDTKELSMSEAVDQAAGEGSFSFSDDWGNQEESLPSSDSPQVSSSESNKEEVKPESAKAKPSEETPQTKDAEQDLPEELKTPQELASSDDMLKRIKGFQASYTKKMQELSHQGKELETKLRNEYEGKLREIVTRIQGQSPSNQSSQPKTSLRDFFPEADPRQLEPLEQAFSAMIEARVKPLKEENDTLKGQVNAFSTNASLVSTWEGVKSKYKNEVIPPSDDIVPDLVAWKHIHPEFANVGMEGIYRLWAAEKLPTVVKEKALSEMKTKEKESLESDSSPNTVENFEVKNLWDAVKLAERDMMLSRQKNNRKDIKG